jgi:quinol monooxygenase YgiN
MKIITGIWKIKENEIASFLNLCKKVKELAIKEKGCISFSYTEYKDIENTFLFFEEWQDQNAIDFHISQLYFIDFMENTKPMLTEKSLIKIYNIESYLTL